MNRLSTLLVLALSSVTLAACGVKLPGVKLPGGSTVGGGTVGDAPAEAASTSGSAVASSAASDAADVADPDDLPRPVKAELVAYYKKLDHKALYKRLTGRRDDVYEEVKAELGRDLLWQSGNPDPAWIKVWKTHDWSYASGNAETLTQAAFNRTWEEACKAEFEQTRLAHAHLVGELEPELAAVDALTNHYARMAGYVALAAKFEQAAAAAGLDPRQDPFGPAGFRVTILAHAVAYHQGSRGSYTDFPWAKFGPLVRDVREHGRELTADAAFERQAYCAVASDRGGLAITPFTSIWGGGHASAKNVAWPTVTGDEDAVAARAKDLVAAAGKQLVTRDGARLAVVDQVGGLDYDEREPALAWFRDQTVDAVAADGAGVKLTLSKKQFASYSYACKETRIIDSISDDGHINYRTNCKSGEIVYASTATVSFAELPPGLTLAKGDVVSFTADVVSDASKKVKDTAAKVEWSRKTTATGRLLTEVKHGTATTKY